MQGGHAAPRGLQRHQRGVAQHVAQQHGGADQRQAQREGAVAAPGPQRHGAGGEVAGPRHLHARARRIDDDQQAVDVQAAALAQHVEPRQQQPAADLGGEHAQRVAGVELQRGDERQRQHRQAQHRQGGDGKARRGVQHAVAHLHGTAAFVRQKRQQAARPGDDGQQAAEQRCDLAVQRRGGQGANQCRCQPRQARRAAQLPAHRHQQRGQGGERQPAERVVRAIGHARRHPAPGGPQRGGLQRDPREGRRAVEAHGSGQQAGGAGEEGDGHDLRFFWPVALIWQALEAIDTGAKWSGDWLPRPFGESACPGLDPGAGVRGGGVAMDARSAPTPALPQRGRGRDTLTPTLSRRREREKALRP